MNELNKLIEMLESTDAEFEVKENYDLSGGWQVIIYKNGEKIDDAVYSKWSHGHEKGLLETYILNDCEGYETAEEIFNGWEKMFLEMQ